MAGIVADNILNFGNVQFAGMLADVTAVLAAAGIRIRACAVRLLPSSRSVDAYRNRLFHERVRISLA